MKMTTPSGNPAVPKATPEQVAQHAKWLLKSMTRDEAIDHMNTLYNLLIQSASTSRKISSGIEMAAMHRPGLFGGKSSEEIEFWQKSACDYDTQAQNTAAVQLFLRRGPLS
jgi:hypothetical protein